MALAAAVSGCTAAPDGSAVPSYDAVTRQLDRVAVDTNGDGRLDQWTYMAGNRPLRSEADTDGDGRIDRWEYLDAIGGVQRAGTSSRRDGVEDVWTWGIDSGGERRVDLARRHDRQIDRREFFRGDALVRAEEDTNADGQPDKWERYEAGVLREVLLDTTHRAARPDRRLRYGADGQFAGMDVADATGALPREGGR
jgi:hypothetical protein